MAFMPPFGPQGMQQAPTAPPPQTVPPRPLNASTLAVDPGAIRGCLFRNTYVWPRGGQGFWFYPVFVGRTSVAGFRWNGFFWMYTGIDLQRIESFTCF
ncbi:transporter [Cohnella sp. 56]|uniref:transporter n=1 Tax=Cohnella sp. 56 TaxID=3113722 RepID=UPI0030E8C5DE